MWSSPFAAIRCISGYWTAASTRIKSHELERLGGGGLEAGRARWKQDPDGIDYPVVVSWYAVTGAVNRLRKRPSQAPGPAEAAAANQGQNAADPVITRTGAQGHPSSMADLVAPELAKRRAAAGETLSTMKGEAAALSKWLASEHPSNRSAAAVNRECIARPPSESGRCG